MDQIGERTVKFNLNSYLSLGIVVAILGGAVWVGQKISDFDNSNKINQANAATERAEIIAKIDSAKAAVEYELREFGHRVDGLETRTGALETAIKTPAADRWTSSDMFEWAVRLQRENKTMVVPDPKHSQ